jgi:hypothetical protein
LKMLELFAIQEEPSPPNLNLSVCDTSLQIGNYKITDSVIIPFCLLAAAIGFSGGYQILKAKEAVGRISYAISFFMFGSMMLTAMALHCFLHDNPKLILTFVLAVIDLSLSSNVALSFSFNGLIDLGILGDTTCSFGIMICAYLAVTGLWVYALLGSSLLWWFNVLYVDLIGLCCGTFVLSKIVYFFLTNKYDGAMWLLSSGLAGSIGFVAISFPQISIWLCVNVTPYLNYDFWWYSSSDIAMYCLCMYFFASRVDVFRSLNRRRDDQS